MCCRRRLRLSRTPPPRSPPPTRLSPPNCACLAPHPTWCLQVRTASCAGTACVNSFGDEQLAVDMLADKLLFEALRFSVSVAFGALCALVVDVVAQCNLC